MYGQAETLTLALALLLGLAVIFDLGSRKIPNRLIAAGWLIALAFHFADDSLAGLAEGLSSGCLALLCGLPFYLLRVFGAGDVKLFSMMGAFMGWPEIGWVGLLSLWAATLFGLLYWGWLSLAGAGGGDAHRKGASPSHRRSRQTPRTFPFAPFLALGAALGSQLSARLVGFG